MASRSKVKNWILSKLIQLLTIIQIICLVIFVFASFPFPSTLLPYMSEVSYYLSPYLCFFLEESERKKIPTLASMVFVNICLIYCTWMEKPSFDYWQWRVEKTGRGLLVWLIIIGLVSTKFLKKRPCEKSLVDFCTYALLLALKINLLYPEKHRDGQGFRSAKDR